MLISLGQYQHVLNPAVAFAFRLAILPPQCQHFVADRAVAPLRYPRPRRTKVGMSDEPARWIDAIEERTRRNLGRALFAARWIMMPIYVGLLFALALIVVKFAQKLITAIPTFLALSGNETIFLVLNLVDLSLVANLVVIVIFAGWENFVGRLLATQGDRPEWLSGLGFSSIKLRLIGSITAIAAILILETFVHVDEFEPLQVGLQLAILLGIGVVGVLLALADKLGEDGTARHAARGPEHAEQNAPRTRQSDV
jgi:uncharacterized protein (TIGR00645 family)